ncbi:hypothetical protein EON65_28960 [archaeon]|nr:MAG: hypothetical protein EON65_28960 [archaeon]
MGQEDSSQNNSTLIERILSSLSTIRPYSSIIKVHPDLRNNISHAMWPIRNARLFTWEHVAYDAKAGGHRWCSLQRDNWSCTGENYINYLRRIPQFNASFYHPNFLRRGTKIFFEGNSYLAQIMVSLICETNPTVVYRLDNVTNDILAYYAESDVLILGIDNDQWLQTHPSQIARLLQAVGFYPLFLIIGPSNFKALSNSNQTMSYQDRMMTFYSIWQESVLVPLRYYHVKQDCAAEFFQCQQFPKFNYHHQCFPGSMIPIAQRLMEHMQNEDRFVNLMPSAEQNYYRHSSSSTPYK